MLLFRALNDYDIVNNPLKNGIASKQMIYELVKSYYENNKIENKEYFDLNEVERKTFIKEHTMEYLKSYNDKLEKLFVRSSNYVREDVREYRKFLNFIRGKSTDEILELVKNYNENINFGSYINFIRHLSGLQRHLLYGSNKTTDWISTSVNIDSVMKYYDNQHVHNIAIIESNTNGIIDSDDIMSVDLSTFEKIKQNSKYLCNKIDTKDDSVIDIIAELSRIDPMIMLNFKNKIISQTNINSRGFKYSISSKELCILRYIPKEHILSILESIQIDLVRCERFNENFIYLTLSQQLKELKRFKMVLLEQLKLINDSYLLFLFYELYINNKNINDLVTFNQSKKYIEHNRDKILSLSLRIPSLMIK